MGDKKIKQTDNIKNVNENAVVSALMSNLPLGMLIVNEKCEIEFMNQKLESFFKEKSSDGHVKFGNHFLCRTLKDYGDICGTQRSCRNCKLKQGFIDAKVNQAPVENISYKGVFGNNQSKENKWFDLSILPTDTNQFIVLFNDKTSLLPLKLNEEAKAASITNANYAMKHVFHEKILEIIESTSYNDKSIKFLHIHLSDFDIIKNQLGQLWVEDFLYNVYRNLVDLIDMRDIICKMTEKDLMIYFNDKSLEDIEDFKSKVKEKIVHRLCHRVNLKQCIIEMDIDEIKVEKLIENDQLHLSYFEILNQIMNADYQYQQYELG